MRHRAITLIGMSGVGKTSIGKALAKSLSYQFMDIDHLIQDHIQLSLYDYVTQHSEAEFLSIEETTVCQLTDWNQLVIATGGSVVYSDRAMKWLRAHSWVIFLDDHPDHIQARVKNLKQRGIIELDTMGFNDVYAKRYPLYKRYAHILISLVYPFNIKQNVALIRDQVFDLLIQKIPPAIPQ